ncbi:MAG: proton-conducting transporter transmembrane domain-containing protein, partial [Acidimicrobiales bacterium]
MVEVLLAVAALSWVTAAASGVTCLRRAGRFVTSGLSGLGGAAAAVSGALMALHPGHTVLSSAASPVVGGLSLAVSPLAAVFVCLLGLVAVAIALYVPRYHHRGPGMAVYMTAYNFALLSALGVLLAANVVTFLVCWESMTLLSYLLVLRDHAVPGVAQAGFWFLALGEVGFGLVTAAFVMLAVKTHTTSLVQMAAASRELTGGYRDTVYLLALVGFGFKAGIVPLHVWLPRAHP